MSIDPGLVSDSAETGKNLLRGRHPRLAGSEFDDVLDSRFGQWERETYRKLDVSFPLKVEYRELDNSRFDLDNGRTTGDSLGKDIDIFSKIEPEKGSELRSVFNKTKSTRYVDLHQELISVWAESLERRKIEWVMTALEKRRNDIIVSMDRWLNIIETVSNIKGSFSLGNGILWDLVSTDLSDRDGDVLVAWAELFRNDPTVVHICEMLGRMCSFSDDPTGGRDVPHSARSMMPDVNSREELIGIELGNRIEDILPSELGLLNDPDFQILFDLKYFEQRLSCFSKQGYISMENSVVEKVRIMDNGEMAGPIIFCIDTGGSMKGTPERIAKAFAFYVAMRASAEKRRCFLINYSVAIDTVELTPPAGLKELLSFLGKSFHGGTDIKPALLKAMEVTLYGEYRKADIIMISDFVIPPDSFSYLKKEVESAKERGCRFHSLTIGHFSFRPDISEVFDECWHYDTVTGKVTSER